MLFVLAAATALLAYAGYIILIVDKRQAKAVLDNPDIYEALDDKEYDFELPIEIEEYDELRESKPADKCVRHRVCTARDVAAASCGFQPASGRALSLTSGYP